MNLKTNIMDKKLIFGIGVVVTGVILLVTKVITLDTIIDNWIEIGLGLTTVFSWLMKKEADSEIKTLKKENQEYKLENENLKKIK